MAAFSGGVSACNFEEINKRTRRKNKLGRKRGCFGFKKEKSLRDRIKQFNIWYCEKEEYRDKEYSKRRSDKKKRRGLFTKEKFMKRLRWLYTLTVVLWIVGITMTFCSTVKSIGKETTFYDHRVTYRIVGPLVLTAGVVSLLVTEGLKMNFKLGEGRKKPQFYIIQTSTNKKRRNKSQNSYIDNEGKEMISKAKRKRKLFQLSSEMKCISIENMDIEIQAPDTSNAKGDKTSVVTESNEDDFTPVSTETRERMLGTESLNSRSPKRKLHDWKRSHWTKLSQESTTSAEFSVIDENEVMGSSGDSANLRRQMSLGPPRSPGGTFENPLARQWSTNSRASTTSKFSNFSDDAPLIKR